MATLNSISENIAYALGEQFNDTFKQSIKDSIIDYRAMLIRQDLDNNPLSYTDYLQSFCVDLKLVNRSECPTLSMCSDKVLKSVQKIPKPLRIKNNGRINFKFVGSVDRSTSLTFATGHEMQYMEYLPLQDEVIYYTVINGYLYILNNIKLCTILIEEIIADPRTIDDCEFPTVFPDDIDFPIPEDMLVKIKQLIKKEYPRFVKDGQEVEIEKDDRP